MKSAIVKFSPSTKEVTKVKLRRKEKRPVRTRIDEEDLFNLFTANIMKLKKKFVR